MKIKKALVFFSSGLGDALLLVPLVNALLKDDCEVTGLFNSPYKCEQLFQNTGLPIKKAVINNKWEALWYMLTHLNQFDTIYINPFAHSRINLLMAKWVGKSIHIHDLEKLSLKSPKISIHPVIPNIHDALQNLKMYDSKAELNNLNFDLHYINNDNHQRNKPYAVIQISSANNKQAYKNWSVEHWMTLLDHLHQNHHSTNFYILGDQNETAFNDSILQKNYNNIYTLIGKTSVTEAVDKVRFAKYYIGLDSAFMHLAYAFDIPTFTIWGASNPQLYGYAWKDKSMHSIIRSPISCSPCSAWHSANHSRVKHPSDCPDFACIKTITSQAVIKELELFICDISQKKS